MPLGTYLVVKFLHKKHGMGGSRAERRPAMLCCRPRKGKEVREDEDLCCSHLIADDSGHYHRQCCSAKRMLIKVKFSGDKEEWTILEFQGTLSGEFAGEELGELSWTPEGEVTMDIGLHTLNGRVNKMSSFNLIFYD